MPFFVWGFKNCNCLYGGHKNAVFCMCVGGGLENVILCREGLKNAIFVWVVPKCHFCMGSCKCHFLYGGSRKSHFLYWGSNIFVYTGLPVDFDFENIV